MCKGNATTTQQSSTSASPQATAAYSNVLNQAANVAATPYQAYTGQLTAPVNAQQTAGISGINANANAAQPYLTQAAGLAGNAAQPLTAAQIQQYQNPYTQQVVNATQKQFNDQNAQQQAGVTGNAISQGALGGNRVGVAQGVLAGQQQLAQAPVIAGLYNQGYNQAVSTAENQQQAGLQGAYGLSSIGNSIQNAGLSGANAQIGAGTLQQQTQQAQDTANYGQYAQSQAYPFQTAQWLAGVDSAVGPGLGSSSQGTTTGPPPNQTAGLLGLGTAAAGAAGQAGLWSALPTLFAAHGGRITRSHGGGVPGLAMGGTPWSFAQGWVPTFGGAGSTAPRSTSGPSLQNPQTPNIDYSKLGTSMGNLFAPNPAYGGGSPTSGDAYGGSSSNPLPGLSASDYGPGFARGGGVAGYDTGGTPTFDDRFNAAYPNMTPDPMPGVGGGPAWNPDEPYRMPDQGAMDAWRAGNPVPPLGTVPVAQSDEDGSLPPEITGGSSGPSPGVGAGDSAMAFAQPATTNPAGAYYAPVTTPTDAAKSEPKPGLSNNFWSGLTTAGLAMMASRSPFLGNAIGEGGIAGLTAYGAAQQHDEKVAAEAQKLADAAKQHAEEMKLKQDTLAETVRSHKAGEAEGWKPTYGVIREENDPDSGMARKVYGWIDPNTKKVVPGPAATPTADGSPPSSKPPVDANGKIVTGQAYLDWLNTVSPKRAAQAKLIGDYKENPAILSRRGNNIATAITDASRYNEDYDQRFFTGSNRAMSNFMGGQEGRAVRSLNVATDHLDTLDQAALAMKNGDYPKLNQIANYFRTQTGSPLATNFDSIKQAVSAEIAKSVVGGPTALHDRDDMAQRANNASSPAQLTGITGEFRKLMAGQMNGLRKSYEVGTRAKNFDDFLLPATKKALANHRDAGDTWSGGQEGGTQGGATPATPAVPQTKIINGVTYVNRNGQWFAQ